MGDLIRVFDDVLPNADAYRARALAMRFQSIKDSNVVFHGIAPCADPTIPLWLVRMFPEVTPTLSFFRQSPEGQEEPHLIHDDRSMGDWTGIYYVTRNPPDGDGTAFYKRTSTGDVASSTAIGSPEWQAEAQAWFDLAQWEQWELVPARFNRLVLFPAALFHARAIPENFGEGDDARLIQVIFGTGQIGRA